MGGAIQPCQLKKKKALCRRSPNLILDTLLKLNINIFPPLCSSLENIGFNPQFLLA